MTKKIDSFDEYSVLALRTSSKATPDEGQKYTDRISCSGLGIAEEAGEAAGNIKKHLYHGHDLNREKFLKELGDTLWYLNDLADAVGSSLGEVAAMNVEKLRARYPDGFTEDASRNRKDD